MKRIAAFSGLVIVSVLLTGCASGEMTSGYESDKITNTNPRNGWVEVQPYERDGIIPEYEEGIYKKCDGTTLMYVNITSGPATSITTVPDSPECVG